MTVWILNTSDVGHRYLDHIRLTWRHRAIPYTPIPPGFRPCLDCESRFAAAERVRAGA